MSVPEAVRRIVTGNRSIHDCMKMGVINFTALAARIQPEIERMLGNPVSPNTVVVAIKRYADSFDDSRTRNEQILKNARLVLTDGIMDIKISSKDSAVDPAAILDKFSKVAGSYDFFRLSDSFRFVTEDMEDVRRIFSGVRDRDGMFSTGLARIRISMPPSRNQSDVVSYVAEVLHANGIELTNAFFGQDGITVILDGGDASRAYEILRSDIKS